MRFEIYIRVEGQNFDPAIFDSSLPAGLRGTVIERKNLRNDRHGVMRLLWKSPHKMASSFPENDLISLLDEFRDDLLNQRATNPKINITAQLVLRYSANDDPPGYYFSKDLIKRLAELEGDLDIDAIVDSR